MEVFPCLKIKMFKLIHDSAILVLQNEPKLKMCTSRKLDHECLLQQSFYSKDGNHSSVHSVMHRQRKYLFHGIEQCSAVKSPVVLSYTISTNGLKHVRRNESQKVIYWVAPCVRNVRKVHTDGRQLSVCLLWQEGRCSLNLMWLWDFSWYVDNNL